MVKRKTKIQISTDSKSSACAFVKPRCMAVLLQFRLFYAFLLYMLMVKMTVDAMGEHCPIPVVKTKKALGKLQGAGKIEVLVDNETAMKNVMKMAKSSGASAESEKISEDRKSTRLNSSH